MFPTDLLCFSIEIVGSSVKHSKQNKRSLGRMAQIRSLPSSFFSVQLFVMLSKDHYNKMKVLDPVVKPLISKKL